MADYFSTSPSFVNPSYATPEQLANERAYAAELMKQSGQEVKHPAGALANALLGIAGGLERNRANALQNEAATANAGNMTALISQLQGGQKIDPQNLGHIIANPMVSPEQRALAIELMRPKGVEDVVGRPGYASPVQGVQATPVQGNFQPGYRAPESAGSVSTVTPIPAPMPAQRPKLDAVSPQGGIFGGMNSSPVGWNGNPPPAPTAAPSGGQAPGAVPPAAPAPAAPTFNERFTGGSRLDALAAKDRELSAEKARTEGGAKAEAENIGNTVTQANSARQFGQDASVMEDLIRSNPKMEFGAWAKPTNEVLRIIQNITGDKLVDAKTLAASDATEKLNLSLAAAMQSRWGLNPSAINLAQGSTPGNEKSRQGTLDLLGLMKQGAKRDEYIATSLYPQFAQAGKLSEFPAAVSKFYQANPLVEPNTGHLIMDPVPIQNPQDEKRLGLKKGTPVKLPDGRIGWVP